MKGIRVSAAVLVWVAGLVSGCACGAAPVLEQHDAPGPVIAPRPAPSRVLVLGNSITAHGPSPTIGWTGDWGMAASARERDFAHLVAAALEAGTLQTVNVGAWETGFTSYDYASLSAYARPDLLVVKVGENVTYSAAFEASLQRLLDAVAPGDAVLVSTWWTGPQFDPINLAMKRVAEVNRYAWAEVPIHDRTFDALTFENRGVAAHPGDNGMQLIAESILAQLRRRGWVTR